MLYPKEDKMTYKLMFACRTCQYSEEAQSSCVFRNNMYNTVGETAGVTQDVGSDPTVGLDRFICVAKAPFRDAAPLDLCALCGSVISDEERLFVDEEEAMPEEEGSEDKSHENSTGFDLAWMAQMEEEDEMYNEEEEMEVDGIEEKEEEQQEDPTVTPRKNLFTFPDPLQVSS